MPKIKVRDRDVKESPNVVYVDRVVEKMVPSEPKIVEVERVIEVAPDLSVIETALAGMKAPKRAVTYRFTIKRDANQRMAEVIATPIDGNAI